VGTADSRPLTAAEKYYAFLDLVSPMNLMMVADIERSLPIDLVAQRWREFVALRAIPRIRIHGDLTASLSSSADPEFRGSELRSDAWDAELGLLSRQPFGLDRPMLCRYLTSPDERVSRLVFVGHHAIFDGRSGVGELQAFVRMLDGQPVPQRHCLPAARPSSNTFGWQADRQQLLTLLRGMSERHAAAGPVEPRPWTHPDEPRVPRMHSLTLAHDEVAGLLDGARIHGSRVYAAIAATWLISVADVLLPELDEPTLQLATPVDIGDPTPDHGVPSAPVVSVVANRHRVTPKAPWELATRIRSALESSLARGEGELFFHLSRVDAIDDLEAGARVLERSLAAAQPAVSVTNLGTIDPGTDPQWLRSMCGYLSPGPNQVVFVSGLGYRGQLVHSVSTDDSQLPPAQSDALVAAYRERSTALKP